MNIAGCAAVVTGAASGLGEATARRLAQQGARVAIFDRDKVRGEQVAKAIDGLFVQVDVSDQESVSEGLAAAARAHTEARILVNCAGIVTARKTTSKGAAHPLEEFQRVLAINLTGTFNCIRLAATRMAALERVDDEERGVIINTASIAAYDGQIGQAAYAAAKGGIVAMTLPIARDLARENIRVVTLAPGIFNTPLMAGLPAEVQAALAAGVPCPARLGAPDEFAHMVQHVCENAYLNAETIRLDGALRMSPR